MRLYTRYIIHDNITFIYLASDDYNIHGIAVVPIFSSRLIDHIINLMRKITVTVSLSLSRCSLALVLIEFCLKIIRRAQCGTLSPTSVYMCIYVFTHTVMTFVDSFARIEIHALNADVLLRCSLYTLYIYIYMQYKLYILFVQYTHSDTTSRFQIYIHGTGIYTP